MVDMIEYSKGYIVYYLLSVHQVSDALGVLPLLQLHQLLKALQLLRLPVGHRHHQLLLSLLPQTQLLLHKQCHQCVAVVCIM